MNARSFRLRALILCVPVLATAAPISFTEQGLRAGEAQCQDGTCCPEPKSKCIVGSWTRPDKYFKSSGSCTEVAPNPTG